MLATAHVFRKKIVRGNGSRVIPFRKPKVARECKSPGTFYHPRDHEASPFFKVVRDHFEEFKRVYPEKFQAKYEFWRPVIRSSIDKFLKCGDLKERFARVRCPDRAVEIWQKKVFELLLNEKKIDQETVASMRTWRHSGFIVDNSVHTEAKDHAAMQRLVEYTLVALSHLPELLVLQTMVKYCIGHLLQIASHSPKLVIMSWLLVIPVILKNMSRWDF